MDSYKHILNHIESYFEPLGFECYPFKVIDLKNLLFDNFTHFRLVLIIHVLKTSFN